MKLFARLTLLFLLLVGIQTVTYAIIRAGMPQGVSLPTTDLHAMPLELGGWSCQDTPGDPDLRDAAGAAVSLRRACWNSEGAVLSLYTAVWTEYDGILQHTPQECYAGHGNEFLGTIDVNLKRPDGTKVAARMLQMQYQRQPTFVLYWYQLGKHVILDQNQMRRARWSFRGASSWPPLVKVMLDVRGSDPETARRNVTDLAEKVLGWTTTNL